MIRTEDEIAQAGLAIYTAILAPVRKANDAEWHRLVDALEAHEIDAGTFEDAVRTLDEEFASTERRAKRAMDAEMGTQNDEVELPEDEEVLQGRPAPVLPSPFDPDLWEKVGR